MENFWYILISDTDIRYQRENAKKSVQSDVYIYIYIIPTYTNWKKCILVYLVVGIDVRWYFVYVYTRTVTYMYNYMIRFLNWIDQSLITLQFFYDTLWHLLWYYEDWYKINLLPQVAAAALRKVCHNLAPFCPLSQEEWEVDPNCGEVEHWRKLGRWALIWAPRGDWLWLRLWLWHPRFSRREGEGELLDHGATIERYFR